MNKFIVFMTLVVVTSFSWANSWSTKVVDQGNGNWTVKVEHKDRPGEVINTRHEGAHDNKKKQEKPQEN